MSATTHRPETTFVAEPGTHETTTTAVIDAPRDKVFRAHTEADLDRTGQAMADALRMLDAEGLLGD
jgi:hypothetical protein